jgi:hypothetical protein
MVEFLQRVLDRMVAGWTRVGWAVNAGGGACSPLSSTAVAWSIDGAFACEAGHDGPLGELPAYARQAYTALLRRWGVGSLSEMNLQGEEVILPALLEVIEELKAKNP